MMNWRVPLSDLDYGTEEETAVVNVLKSRWLTMGEVTQEFEKEFAALTGAKYSFAVSNATQALHLACIALGIGAGDEVIVPSLTFVATANAVLYTGAEVKFADILGSNDLTVDPQAIEKMITPRTKAIIVMHYAGYPCQMEALLAIAKKYGLSVIEDAAHAPGASLNGKMLGTWGDAGCFSFFSNKNLSTGEGGMVVTDRDDLAEKIRLQRSHGMTTLTYDRHQGHAYTYDVVDLGYNYRIDEIRSALGLAQLTKLAKNNQRRAQFTHLYWELLSGSQVELPFKNASGMPAYHIFPMLLPEGINRFQFIDKMREAGVQTSIHYPPAHRFTYYRNRYGEISLPVTEQVASREVTLPLFPTMKTDDVRYVVESVKNALKNLQDD
ncbi:MAG: DegT/DnrJ/EryC1/StrS family aminotransferase [Anaerolineaceae bacterium]